MEGVTAKYWVDSRPARSNAESYREDVAARLWDASRELTGAACDLARRGPAAARVEQRA